VTLLKALRRVARDNGYDTVNEMLSAATTDSVSPSLCTSCLEEGDEVEPDAQNYHCPHCHKATLSSVLVLVGIC
jgi:hypothetical protein